MVWLAAPVRLFSGLAIDPNKARVSHKMCGISVHAGCTRKDGETTTSSSTRNQADFGTLLASTPVESSVSCPRTIRRPRNARSAAPASVDLGGARGAPHLLRSVSTPHRRAGKMKELKLGGSSSAALAMPPPSTTARKRSTASSHRCNRPDCRPALTALAPGRLVPCASVAGSSATDSDLHARRARKARASTATTRLRSGASTMIRTPCRRRRRGRASLRTLRSGCCKPRSMRCAAIMQVPYFISP